MACKEETIFKHVFKVPFTASIHVVKDVASTCAITGYQPGRQLIIHPTNQPMRDFKVSGHVIFKNSLSRPR